MKKLSVIFFFLIAFSLTSNAQKTLKLGDNTGVIDPSAILDLDASTHKLGLKLPNVSLSGSNDMSLPSIGLIVYNTNTVTGVNAITPGVYIFDGTKWNRLATSLTGNTVSSLAGTNNQVLVNGTTAAQTGDVTLTLPQDISTTSAVQFGTVTATTFIGSLIGNATSATNISGGAAGSLPYQTGTGTAFTAVGATGSILQSTGATAPVWVPLSSVGVSGLNAGPGIATSASTGNITITNTGVTNIIGTINQITASAGTGNVTLFLPQNINTTADVQFNNITATSSSVGSLAVTNLAPSGIVTNNASGLLGTISYPTLTTSLSGTAPINITGTAGAFAGNLSGDVTGPQTATIVNTVGGSTATNIHNAELLANTATDLNTANTIVKRDLSGNFIAGTMTGNLSGTATNASNILGGSAGSIPYQSSANNTVLLPIGASGQVLSLSGTTPSWSTPTTGTVTSVTANAPLTVATGTTTPVLSLGINTNNLTVTSNNLNTIQDIGANSAVQFGSVTAINFNGSLNGNATTASSAIIAGSVSNSLSVDGTTLKYTSGNAFNGSANTTLGLNLANPNTWTAIQNLNGGLTASSATINGPLSATNANFGNVINANGYAVPGGTSSQVLLANGTTASPSSLLSGTYVPYTAANANVNLGSYGISAGNISATSGTFNTLTAGTFVGNLSGSKGSIPYESAVNTTSMLPPTSAGQILTLTGTAGNLLPSWQSSSAVSVSSVAGTANQILANGTTTAQTGAITLTLPTSVTIGTLNVTGTASVNALNVTGTTSTGNLSATTGTINGSLTVTGTTTVNALNITGTLTAGASGVGTSGYVLTSNGNAAPTWQNTSLGTVSNLSITGYPGIVYQNSATSTGVINNSAITTTWVLTSPGVGLQPTWQAPINVLSATTLAALTGGITNTIPRFNTPSSLSNSDISDDGFLVKIAGPSVQITSLTPKAATSSSNGIVTSSSTGQLGSISGTATGQLMQYNGSNWQPVYFTNVVNITPANSSVSITNSQIQISPGVYALTTIVKVYYGNDFNITGLPTTPLPAGSQLIIVPSNQTKSSQILTTYNPYNSQSTTYTIQGSGGAPFNNTPVTYISDGTNWLLNGRF